MWEVEFFELDSGRCPTREFLKDLNSADEMPYITEAFKRLEEFGNRLDMPHSKPLGDGFYELRIRVIKKQFRFVYFYFNKTIIVVTHGFKKKSSEVPQKELTMAKKYRKIYFSNYGGNK